MILDSKYCSNSIADSWKEYFLNIYYNPPPLDPYQAIQGLSLLSLAPFTSVDLLEDENVKKLTMMGGWTMEAKRSKKLTLPKTRQEGRVH